MSSYLYSGVMVNCTMMTNGKPLKLMASRSIRNVITTNKKALILNIDDKKISDTFQCKQASKFWGGLQMFAAIIAVAAFVALTVATGGTTLIIAAVAFTAAAGTSLYAGAMGLYTVANDCDYTLKSEWHLFHKKVSLDSSKAIVLHSCLKCTKGGIVQPFMDSALAYDAAKKISDNNLKEFYENEEAQALIGVVSVLSVFDPRSWKNMAKGPSGIGLLVVGVFGVMEYTDSDGSGKEGIITKQSEYSDSYYSGEEKEIEGDKFDYYAATRDNTVGTAGGTLSKWMDMTKINTENSKEATKWSEEAINRKLAGASAQEVESAELASVMLRRNAAEFEWKGLGVGLVSGVAASVINYKIGKGFHASENELFVNTQKYMENKSEDDAKNNFGVVARGA